MSIIRTQKFLEKSGCSTILLVLLGGTMVVGALQCNRQNQGQGQGPGQTPASEVAITYDDKQIPFTQVSDSIATGIDNAEKNALSQEQQQKPTDFEYKDHDSISAPARAMATATGIAAVVDQAIILKLAEQNGVQLDDASIHKIFREGMDDSLNAQRVQMISLGMLKEGATNEEFIEAYKKTAGGKTPDDLRKQQDDELKTALADPERAPGLRSYAAEAGLTMKLANSQTVDVNALKKEVENRTFQAIAMPQDPKIKGDDVMVRAKKVLADIRSGKTTFVDAMVKHSVQEPMPGKKKADMTVDYDVKTLRSAPSLIPLTTMKVGEISEPLPNPGGGVPAVTIYKLIKAGPPANFDKEIAYYKRTQQIDDAHKKVIDMLNKERSSAKLKFASKGLELMFAVIQESRKEGTKHDWASLVEKTKAAAEDAARDNYTGAAYFLAARLQLEQGDAASKDKNEAAFYAAAEKYLESTEDAALRLEIVQYYIKKKDPKAVENLIQASAANNRFSDAAQARFQAIFKAVDDLKKLKLLPAEAEKTINESQAKWVQEKKQFDEYAKQRKDQDLKDRAEAAAAQKKQEEEDKKAKAAAEKAGKTGAKPEAPASGSDILGKP